MDFSTAFRPILTSKRTGWSQFVDMNNGHPKLKTEEIKL